MTVPTLFLATQGVVVMVGVLTMLVADRVGAERVADWVLNTTVVLAGVLFGLMVAVGIGVGIVTVVS